MKKWAFIGTGPRFLHQKIIINCYSSMTPTIWKIVPFWFTVRKEDFLHFSNFCREFYIHDPAGVLLCYINNPFVGITTLYSNTREVYILWIVDFASGQCKSNKGDRIARGAASESVLVTRHLQRDQTMEDKRDETQNTNEIDTKFIKNLCSNI